MFKRIGLVAYDGGAKSHQLTIHNGLSLQIATINKMKERYFSLPVLLLIVAGVLVASVVWFEKSHQASNLPISLSPTTTVHDSLASSTPTTSNSGIPIWQTYRNTKFHFTLQYPATWNIDEESGIAPNSVEIIPSEVIVGSIVKSIDAYVSVEPGSCENKFGPIAKTSIVVINGISMEKIETNIFPASSTGRFTLLTFPGDPSRGWDSQCNTIRLYVPPAEPTLGNTAKAQQYMQDRTIEDNILESFTFAS